MQYDIERISLELDSLPEFDAQLMLQGVEGQTDPTYGVGNPDHCDHVESDFVHPLFEVPYINEIIEKERMYRTRVMRMKPKTCLSWHVDYGLRKHIPVFTNPEKCFIVCEDEVIRMPADGNVYILDGTKRHTAVNAQMYKERIHIVGCFDE